MSTTTMDRPLRPVLTPNDAEDVRLAVQEQKRHFGAFLAAKDALLGYAKTAGQTTADLMERYHLGGAVRLAQRACGWLLSGLSMARRGLRSPDVRAGVLLSLPTRTGQSVVKRVARPVAVALVQAGGLLLTGTDRFLRLFGRRGSKQADQLQQAVSRLRKAVAVRRAPLHDAADLFLSPSGLLMQGIRTVAQARLLRSSLSRLLPARWHWLGRVLAGVLMVPSWIRRDALVFLSTRTAPAAVPTSGPDDHPTPPAAPAAGVPLVSEVEETASPAMVVNLDQARVQQGQANQPEPGMQRYPAPKRKAGNRK